MRDYNDSEEGWINEIGTILTSDFVRIVKIPFKGLFRAAKWFGYPRNIASILELATIIVVWFWGLGVFNAPLIVNDGTATLFTAIAALVSLAWWLGGLASIVFFIVFRVANVMGDPYDRRY